MGAEFFHTDRHTERHDEANSVTNTVLMNKENCALKLVDEIILFLGAFAELRKKKDYYLRHVCPSVRTHGTTRLSLYGFSLNLISEYLSKICRETSSATEIGQE